MPESQVEIRDRIERATFGGVDEWAVTFRVRTGRDALSLTDIERLIPELIEGGIAYGVRVVYATRERVPDA